jgi:voltage-gated potassium channel Kch
MAAGTIVTATVLTTVGGGVLMRLIDHSEYPSIWKGMWWSIQTVTTVGYGDVTPKHVSGRIVAAFVMLEGIAFLAIITAAVASTFVSRALAERKAAEEAEELSEHDQLVARLDELDRKLDRLQESLRGSDEI